MKNTIKRVVKKELTAEEQKIVDEEKFEAVKKSRQAHKTKYKMELMKIKAKVRKEKEEETAKLQMIEDRKKKVKQDALKKIQEEKLTNQLAATIDPSSISHVAAPQSVESRDDGAGTATVSKAADLGAGSALTAIRKRNSSVDESAPAMTEEERKRKKEINMKIAEKQKQELLKLKKKNDEKKKEEEKKKSQLRKRELILKAKYNANVEKKDKGDDDEDDEEEEEKVVAAAPKVSTKPPLARKSKVAKAIEEASSTVSSEERPRAHEQDKHRLQLVRPLALNIIPLSTCSRVTANVLPRSQVNPSSPSRAVIKDTTGAVVKVLSAAEVATATSRLSKRNPNKSVGYRDFDDYKKKNGLEKDDKVFNMTGWYPCVKDDLIERGWYLNDDRESPFFDLKWTLRSSDVKPGSMQPWQLTNHFLKNTAITTKIGLQRSLHNLSWFASENEDSIFPRGYDLNLASDLENFLDDYRCLRAESLLKLVLVRAMRFGFEVDFDLGDLTPNEEVSACSESRIVPLFVRFALCRVRPC